MDAVFIKLLNMSITASWLVLAVIVLRFILKKTPKWITGILWGFVAVRLICPFSFESIFSLIPSAEPIPQSIITAENPTINSGLPLLNQTVNPIISESLAPSAGGSANPMQIIVSAASVVWIIGIAAMLVYTLASYIRIRRSVREAVQLRDNIWICDNISTPFILGIFSPKIYLPSSMNEADAEYVTAHEKAHLKRMDHIWKPLGFLLLAVYWFNPILWAAYILLCRDIELACDEKVIRQFGAEIKKPYAEALINCSVPRKAITACPLAFGETGVKERVKGVLNYKKPAFWIILAAVAACIITAVCLLTSPAGGSSEINGRTYSISKFYYSDVITVDKANRTLINSTYSVDENFNLYFSNGDGRTYRGTLKLQSDAKELEELIKSVLPPYYFAVGFDKIYIAENESHSACVFAVTHSGDVICVNISRYNIPQQQNIIDAAKLTADEYNADELAEFLNTQIALQHQSDKTGDNFYCINYDILKVKKTDNRVSVYAWVLYEEYSCDGELKLETGASTPTVITADKKDGKYTPIEYWTPRDGSYYANDIKEMFPIYLWSKTLYRPKNRTDKLHADNLKKAQKHFGISADAIGGADEPTVINKKIKDIADRAEKENLSTDTALELFYSDNKYNYYFGSIRGQYVTVTFTDGTQKTVAEALNDGEISLSDLDEYKINYIREEKTDLSKNPAFRAEVLEVTEGSILVKPDANSSEIKSADKISVSLSFISTIPVPTIKAGDRVEIIYNGEIAESYPAQINKVFVIYLLSDDKKVLSPTPFK